ncbi:MAG: hypothetical protein GY784_10590 [Gammaproteobacteria bacterium]|nr:hypothetical protein [Gammaproteobacteria bacterium]
MFVVLLLAALAFFLYLTRTVARDPQKRKYFYLFVIIDLWLAAVFVYLLVTAFMN